MPKHLRSREELTCAVLRACLRPGGVDSRRLYKLIVSCISRYNKEIVVPLIGAGFLSVERQVHGDRTFTLYKITELGRGFYEKYDAYLDMIRTPEMRREIERVHSNINLFNDLFL